MRHEVQSLKQLQRPLDHLPPAAVRGVVSFADMFGFGCQRWSVWCHYSVSVLWLHAFVVWLCDQVIRKDPASRGTEKAADDLGCVVLCGCVSCSCVEI